MLNLGLLTVLGNLGLLTVPGNLGLLTVPVSLKKIEPGSFDGSRELRSFDSSSVPRYALVDLFDYRPLDADRSGAPKLGEPRVFGYYWF